MSKRKISILTLLAAFALSVAAMFTAMGLRAQAADSVATVSVFTTSGDASAVEGAEYLTYQMGDSDDSSYISLRRNVALKWYSFAGEEPAVGDAGEAQYFSLGIGFPETNFEDFTVTLETTQMSMSKEGKSVNEIVFTPAEGGKVNASVNGAAAVTVDAGEIEIALTEPAGQEGYGDFTVLIGGTEAGTFTNIGRYYARYASASADTPITPLSFKASVAGENKAKFEIRSINGQSFKLDENGEILDDAAPVLVVDSEIKQLYLATELDFDYVTIDVCSASVSTDSFYLAYNGSEVVPATDENGEEIAASFNGEGELVGYNDLESDKRFFETDFGGSTDNGALSIAYALTDGNDNTAYYFLEWYASADALDGSRHISVTKTENVKVRPEMDFYTYTANEEDGTATGITENEEAVAAYQEAVTAASYTKDEDGNTVGIRVGSGAYFYVPSLRPYITDASCGYTDMKFTVYYRTTQADTATVSGSYDELRIPVEKTGTFEFCVVPTNEAGKSMHGVFEKTVGGETEYTLGEITSSNVWDAQNVATFTFSVQYTGAVVEAPIDIEVGYVDVSYTLPDFDITSISGYDVRYMLYYFQVNEGVTVTGRDQIISGEKADGTNEYGTWRAINEYDKDLEDTDDEGDNAYEWSPDSSLSFVPQDIGYYKITVEVDDKTGMGVVDDKLPGAYAIVSVSAQADVIPAETYWLQDNVVSVVFLSIAAVCLIAIVVILLIRPKDKAAAVAERTRKEELREKRESRK